jgi:hypothetical protein
MPPVEAMESSANKEDGHLSRISQLGFHCEASSNGGR